MSAVTTREGERRHVTVMFADVSGFTAIARTMDPEDVTDLANACFGILGRAVAEYGGHVDKYIGDCVMALFGAPTAIEDAPRQAVNAAICILERITDLAARRGIAGRIDAHIGINTGLVVYSDVGGEGTRDTTAMGDAVNVASRLRDAAPAQAIYVGSQTHRETANDFRYRRISGLRLKGIESAYDGWEVLSRRPRLHRYGPAEAGPGRLSTLFGREDAMAQVTAAVDRLPAGRGGVLVVTGEAGIGKSRLIREMRSLPAMAGIACIEGCALRVGESSGLYPFVSLLRSWTGIDVDDTPVDARARVVEALDSVLGERTAEVYPFLATMAGLPLSQEDSRRVEGIDAEGMQFLITRSLQEFFERLARWSPVVVILEDLHWADRSSVDLLLRLLALARREPVLFVLVMRPDFESTSRPLIAGIRERCRDVAVEVALGPLDAKAAAALLRERIRFDDRPDRTRRAIVDRAEGNPFFIEEMIRSLADVGAVRMTPEGWRVTEHMSAVQVPGTIQELVMDRVDRLVPAVREVLQSASVVGRAFQLAVLEAVVPDPEMLGDALDQLVRMELLEPLPPAHECDYTFKHALAHETVYEAILHRRRRQLHRLVGQSIESIYAARLDDFYSALALHFSTAEDWEKASFYLLRAGDEAARSTASDEALRCFTEAASIHDRIAGGTDPSTRTEIEKKIGLACLAKGDLPAALDHFDHALELLGHTVPRTPVQMLLRGVTDMAAILTHLYLRTDVTRRRRPPATVVAVAELCFHKGKAQSTTAPQGYVMSMLPAIRSVGAWDFRGVEHACGVYSAGATLFAWSGLSFRLARRLSRAGGQFVRTVPDSVIHETMKFVARYLEGDWDDANALSEDLVEDGLRYGAVWEVNTYLGMYCERLIHKGRLSEAGRVIDAIAGVAERYGYDFARTNERAMRAFALLQAGRLEAAAEAVDRYYEVCHEEPLNLLALATRARILLLVGDRQGARATLEQAEELARLLGRQAAPYHLAPLRVARFACELDAFERACSSGEAAGARLRRSALASRRRALSAAATIARERPECFRLSARLDWARGRHGAAVRWWERAIAEARRLGARPELMRACRESAEALMAAGRADTRVAGQTTAQLLELARQIEGELAADWACAQGGDASRQRRSA